MLQQTIDYDLCQVDPAPFQLVERTSLYKVQYAASPIMLVTQSTSRVRDEHGKASRNRITKRGLLLLHIQ